MRHVADRDGNAFAEAHGGGYGATMPLDRGAWAELRSLVVRFRWPLILGVALTFVDRVASFAAPMLSKVLVDRVAIQHRFDALPVVAGAAAVAAIVQAATTYRSQRVLGLMGQDAVAELRTNLLVRLLSLPISFFDRTALGALVSRVITDTSQVENLLGAGLVPLVGATLSALIGFGLMMSLNAGLAIAMLAVLATFGVWGTRMLDQLRASFTAVSESSATTTAKLTEVLAGISIIKAFAAEPHQSAAFSTLIERQVRIGGRSVHGVASLNTGVILINGATTLVVIAGGGYAVAHGRMTLGDLAAFTLCAGLVAAPVIQLAAMSSVVGKAGAALSRIHELVEMPGEEQTDHRRVPVMDVAGAVTFEDVHYA
jgi:ABC-type bacteriocin/lantibiotic exporter with double-glycine peptidase domain